MISLSQAPTDEDLDNLSIPLIELWQVTSQIMDHGQPFEKLARKKHDISQSVQYLGLKIKSLPTGRIEISVPKITHKILQYKGLVTAKFTCVPYVIDYDSTARKDHEPTLDNKTYMSDVGTLRFVAALQIQVCLI